MRNEDTQTHRIDGGYAYITPLTTLYHDDYGDSWNTLYLLEIESDDEFNIDELVQDLFYPIDKGPGQAFNHSGFIWMEEPNIPNFYLIRIPGGYDI